MTHEKRQYRPPLRPIGSDVPVQDWDELDGGRDGFVAMLSQCIDACATVGYDAPFDAPQIAAWLESPDRADRRRGSFHLALVRQSMEDVARKQPRKDHQ